MGRRGDARCIPFSFGELKMIRFIDWIVQTQKHRGDDWKTISRHDTRSDALIWAAKIYGSIPDAALSDPRIDNVRIVRVKRNSHTAI